MGTLNADNLYLKFAREEGQSVQSAGSYCYADSGKQIIEITIDLTDLTESETIQNDVCIIPAGALLEEVEVLTLVGATAGTAIDLGTIHISRNASDSEWTADPDGILAAFVTASMDTPGQKVRFFGSGTADAEESLPASVTTGGVQIGDVTAAPLLLTCSRTTSTAFTAGRIKVRLHLLPNALTGTGAAVA